MVRRAARVTVPSANRPPVAFSALSGVFAQIILWRTAHTTASIGVSTSTRSHIERTLRRSVRSLISILRATCDMVQPWETSCRILK
ncbi:hypothetical protein M2168_006370 [Streptomyces sp. CZ24]|nr:hypothetical protein [Streptomyces sp. CZ24]